MNVDRRRYVRVSAIWALFAATVLAACTPSPPSTSATSPRASAVPSQAASRTMVIAIRVEPASLASKPLEAGGVSLTTTRRLFNATLAMFDGQGQAIPYLAESLPQLNTDSWRMEDDGGMTTTYRLKPSVTWHDGIPLDADDFVFAWQVYATPELGLASSPPIGQIQEVTAPDRRTVQIRWKRPYAQAGVLGEQLPPLPKHVLERSYQTALDTFATQPFWTREYVGLGPYRVDRWEPGAFIEGSAFNQHTAGKPRISGIKVIFIQDPNTTVANLLSGDVQLSADDSLRFQQGLTLKREWGEAGGSVLVKLDLWRGTYVQLRPDVTSPRALRDVRVRAALVNFTDRQALNDALFEGQGIMGDVPLIPPSVSYYAAISQNVPKYAYDPTRAEQLLAEAGIVRGSDGVFVGLEDGRLSMNLRTNGSTQSEAELSILGAGWRQAGFDVNELVVPQAQAQDGQVRSTFPALYTFSLPLGEDILAQHTTLGIPRPDNRWIGNNRGGWSDPTFDTIAASFATTLDQNQRIQQIGQMATIFAEQLPALPLYFNPIPIAFSSTLTGPQLVPAESAIAWNVYEWELH